MQDILHFSSKIKARLSSHATLALVNIVLAHETAWLSNFSNHPFEVDGRTWPTVEHYFQGMKFPAHPAYSETIRNAATPAKAKSLGRSREHPLRPDWEQVKEDMMRDGLRAKFTQYPHLRSQLVATGDHFLAERSDSDAYWGDGKNRRGQNRLGHLLMELRAELASDPLPVPEEAESDVNPNAPLVLTEPKAKSHTTALERADKRKRRTRERRNVWRDRTGTSVFQLDEAQSSTAVLFTEGDIQVPLSAFPEGAKHVMRKHQYVRKYHDGVAEDDMASESESEEDLSGQGCAPQQVSLAAFLSPKNYTTDVIPAELTSPQVCIDSVQRILANGKEMGLTAAKLQLEHYLPLLSDYVETVDDEVVLAQLLNTIETVHELLTL